ncbi:MAG: RHS repeat-associated core domain-containing protein [Armatimonadetes bacterium]|nr:RHS repeat-associated core domain-containing protein [Armatimonadota bacterium]
MACDREIKTQYTIVAPKIFQQKLWYDSVGRIVKQESKNGGQGSWLVQGYGYDNVDRLVSWSVGADTTEYSYDAVGNRQLRVGAGSATTNTYGAPSTGPNRLVESELVGIGKRDQTEYGYNLNGSIVERKVFDQMAVPLPLLLSEDYFGYSYRELNWKYISGNPFENAHSDWRYRYNAMGEREQKRLYHAPLADSIAGQPYPWVYYLLGGSKDQLAVWHGQQMTSPFCDTVRQRNVFLYPTEYITHGVEYNGVREDIGQVVTRPDGSKQLRLLDHLASVRASVVIGVSGFSFADYDPWGNLLSGSSEDRRSFNSRERDKESGAYNNGVRKYEEGRFLSVDPLWSKFGSWSPYVYCYDNPLTVTDPQGMQGGVVFDGFDPLDFYDNNMLEMGGGRMAVRGETMGLREFGKKLWDRVFGGGKASEGSSVKASSVSASGGGSSPVGTSSGASASNSSGQSVSTKSPDGGGNGGSVGGKSNNPPASIPVGKNGSPMKVEGNTPTTINGTKFTGHALDRMQGRGITSPSAVLDVLNNPLKIHSGNSPNTRVHVGSQMKVVTNQNGDVITVIPTGR